MQHKKQNKGRPKAIDFPGSFDRPKNLTRVHLTRHLNTHAQKDFTWLADANNKMITVMQRDGSSVLYKRGEAIPLSMFVDDSITVDQIFG